MNKETMNTGRFARVAVHMCGECPHLDVGERTLRCAFANGKIVPGPVSIPGWCPLPKVVETEETEEGEDE